MKEEYNILIFKSYKIKMNINILFINFFVMFKS